MDCGFIFVDGIYEVIVVVCGKFVDNDVYFVCLMCLLFEIGIENLYIVVEWMCVCEELVVCNGLEEGVVYMQVMCGVVECDFGIFVDIMLMVVVFMQVKFIVNSLLVKKGVIVVMVFDLCWKCCDIKSVGLLLQVMVKQIVVCVGVYEVWMIDGDCVIEGVLLIVFIIIVDQWLIMWLLLNVVLLGIMCVLILVLVCEYGLMLEECIFIVVEVQKVVEVFYMSVLMFVMLVVFIDGVQIGNGQFGLFMQVLCMLYLCFVGVDVVELVGQM